MAHELGWSTSTTLGSVMHALANSRQSRIGGSPRRNGRGLPFTLLVVAASVFCIPILLMGGAMVGEVLQEKIAVRSPGPIGAKASADGFSVPTEKTSSTSQGLQLSPPPRLLEPSAPPVAGPLPPIPLPVLASAAPPPASIGELVQPHVVAKAKPAEPSPASVKVHDRKKDAVDTPASVIIDVGGGAGKPKGEDKTAMNVSKATSPTIVKSDETKVQKVQAPAAPSRPTQLKEAVVSLPAPTQVEQRAVGEGVKFAQPRSERGVSVSVQGADKETTGSKNAAPVGRVTIVDIAQDGRSVLVTDPATRLPKTFAVGDVLPNGTKIQSIDPTKATISAGGITYEME